MTKHTLAAVKRTIVGRKVKQLRKAGSIPATIYGKGMTSENISIALLDFKTIIKNAGETGLITLTLAGQEHPVLIQHIQKHPVTDAIVHIELREVNLKEKVKANIAVEIVGEAPAVKEGMGTLLQIVNELEIEALPADIPENIIVDVSGLSEVNASMYVKDIKAIPNVTILTDPEQIIIKIGELLAPEPEPTPVTAVEGEAVPATEATEGEKTEEAPAEAKTEEKK